MDSTFSLIRARPSHAETIISEPVSEKPGAPQTGSAEQPLSSAIDVAPIPVAKKPEHAPSLPGADLKGSVTADLPDALRLGKPPEPEAKQPVIQPAPSAAPLAPGAPASDSTATIFARREGGSVPGFSGGDQKEGSSEARFDGNSLKKIFLPESTKIFGLLMATNEAPSEPHPMPEDVLAIEPMLNNFFYVKTPDGEIALVGSFTHRPFGVLDHAGDPAAPQLMTPKR